MIAFSSSMFENGGFIMEERYERNIPAISEAEQMILNDSHVLVAGCGGLGGYSIEYLARLGVGHLRVMDGDCFSESNLNRQLISHSGNIGAPKAAEAAERVHLIAPTIEVEAMNEFLTAENAMQAIDGMDLAIDALDSPEARLILEDACAAAGISLIHGAIQGWTLQAGVVPPGSGMLKSLYKGSSATSADSAEAKSSLCPTPACCAAIQCTEAVKLLTGKESSLTESILFMDLKNMESYKMELS